jgi:hypothetical protein
MARLYAPLIDQNCINPVMSQLYKHWIVYSKFSAGVKSAESTKALLK